MKTRHSLRALASLTLLSAFHVQAQTNVLYFDPFTAPADSILNGASPASHGGIGTEVWTAPDDGFTMDGTGLTVTSGSRWAALPFVPEEGNKYRVSMNMSPTHTGADWFAIGYAETPTPSSDYPAQRLTGWMLTRGFEPGYPLHSFTGYGTDGGGQAGNFTGPHTLSVVLDTTVDNWTFEFFVDGVSQRGPVPFSATPGVNPSIGYVTFGSYGTARGTMDDFRLENIFHVETGRPTIVTQPLDATVLAGATAKFEVVAAGPKPITYQWFRDGQPIAGETSSKLTLSGLVLADNGRKITANVSNSFGTTTTPAATLTVLDVPGPLIHKITFNDGSANDSLGGVRGALKGSAAIVNGQLSLDGSDGGYVLLSDYALPPAGNATVVAWFRTASTVGKSARVFDFGSGTLNYLYFTPMSDVNGVARFGIKTGEDAETSVTSTPTLNDDREHMVAAVIDSTPGSGANGTMSLYIDGVLVGSSDLNGTISLSGLESGPQNFLGKSQWVNTGDLPYKGFIDEVRVYNTALSATEIAALAPDPNPTAAPVIDTQPRDVAADLGGSAGLSVGVTGSKPFTYQWRLNGGPLADSNTNTFTVTDLEAADFGDYDVVVANAFGSVTSTVARVSLNRWSHAAWNDDASSGVDTNFVYTHAFNFGSAAGTEINGLAFTGVAGGNPSVPNLFTLTGVGNVFNNDANNLPEGSGSRTLANDFIYGGNPGTLTLSGLKPGRQYLLTLYSVAFEDAGRVVRFAAADGQTLVLDQDTFLNDNGIRIAYQYTADASGSFSITVAQVGNGTHHMYGFSNRLLNKVGVAEPPEITQAPQATSAALGASASFTVAAIGTTPIQYQWLFNGQPITGATAATFTDADVQASDFGNYSVIVSNSFGTVTSSAASLALLRFSTAPWTDDASSGIDSQYTYTHAFNFGSTAATTLNGVAFTGVAGGNPSRAGAFAVAGVPNVFNNDANNLPDGSGSRTLANDFIYGGNPGTLTLLGLTPGKQYQLTMFSVGWEDAGRTIRFSADGGQQLVLDQDAHLDNNGIRVMYEYTADTTGTVVVANAQAGIGTHHMYGFANRELLPPGAQVSLQVTSGGAATLVLSWPESAAGFALKSSGSVGAAASWQTVGTTPVVNQGRYQVTVPATAGAQFYRLEK